jgi:hypothetical protein
MKERRKFLNNVFIFFKKARECFIKSNKLKESDIANTYIKNCDYKIKHNKPEGEKAKKPDTDTNHGPTQKAYTKEQVGSLREFRYYNGII